MQFYILFAHNTRHMIILYIMDTVERSKHERPLFAKRLDRLYKNNLVTLYRIKSSSIIIYFIATILLVLFKLLVVLSIV